ncbi:zinc metallopeptidase, partial [Hyaloraphidium curvatum]
MAMPVIATIPMIPRALVAFGALFACLSALGSVHASQQRVVAARRPKCPIDELARWLESKSKILAEFDTRLNEASWAYETNVTDENQEAASRASVEFDAISLKVSSSARKEFRGCIGAKGASEEQDAVLRQFRFVLEMSDGIMSDKRRQKRLTEVVNEMTAIYAKATVNGSLHLDPELTRIMATSRDPKELEYVYVAWRKANYASRKLYEEYVELSNRAARESGFSDMGQLWRSGFDMTAQEYAEMVEKLLEQVMPLYEALHCYAHAKLNAFYGDAVVDPQDPFIPAHLFGNMWSQDWSEIADILRPFPVGSIDITPELRRQNFDAVKMHRLGESFYKSLGFDSLPQTFWTRSMLRRPLGRDVVCHASAWDVGYDDLRIKMCTEATQGDFETVHHEQGHVFYFHYYRDLPYVFRDGAADFFHEAIGDAILFSALNPKHLRDDLNLLPSNSTFDSPESIINTQMTMALGKIAILPFAYLVDRWRWDVFSGSTPWEEANVHYAALIAKWQGMRMPASLNPRKKKAFDAVAKYHISSDTPYTRYFLAAALSFTIHRALCRAIGHQGPLHECSVFGSQVAGEKYKAMLSLGRSKPWQEALATLSGETTVDASAMIEYFAPLKEFLDKQNEGRKCGWRDAL